MTGNDAFDHARYIFTTGKLIHDRVFLIKSACLAEDDKKKVFHDLSMAQLRVLKIVSMKEHVSVTELAALLGVSPPSASVMVDRLVEKKLLIREPSRQDRRRVEISVPPDIRKEFEKIEEAIFRSFVDLVEKIGPETAEKWCEVLEQVKTVLEEEDNGT